MGFTLGRTNNCVHKVVTFRSINYMKGIKQMSTTIQGYQQINTTDFPGSYTWEATIS